MPKLSPGSTKKALVLPDVLLRDNVSIYLGPLGACDSSASNSTGIQSLGIRPLGIQPLGLTVVGVNGFSRPRLQGLSAEGVLGHLDSTYLSGLSAADWSLFCSICLPEGSFVTIPSDLLPFEGSGEFLVSSDKKVAGRSSVAMEGAESE
jgi:hypothetical protein